MVSVRGVDVGRVQEAAASESPVEAVEAVARELGAAFDAAAVSFLIADRFDGGPAEQAVRTQAVQV